MTELYARICGQIDAAGGWLPFDDFMAAALYTPGLGYYSAGRIKLGLGPAGGSDFVTAPEMSPLFGQALARSVAQALAQTGTDEVWEFGAGTGALAEHVLLALQALGVTLRRYVIVELSADLQQRQAERLQPWGATVQWAQQLPETLEAVVLGNEVLDAMPVQLLHFDGEQWQERGVAVREGTLCWADRPTTLRPPYEPPGGFLPGTVTEIHPQAEAFMRTLAQHLQRGAAFFIDYGFPEAEYYHVQRHGGTLMCHHQHRADSDPLVLVGDKDITAHVNFTGIALAAQDAGLTVLGYTSQGHFLLNSGLGELMQQADVPARAMAHRLLAEHEMGELFKVIGLVAGPEFEALGFAHGDRSHTL
ncbi:class I SAM-dependent methyltransferase [Roseateles sp. BYS180W]|uniref:Class I SAM-dependent methyltransferase n=1 Tax=Roseateles rivi TaxID=3299028 RepID=A0ABW7FWT7_9BURK